MFLGKKTSNKNTKNELFFFIMAIKKISKRRFIFIHYAFVTFDTSGETSNFPEMSNVRQASPLALLRLCHLMAQIPNRAAHPSSKLFVYKAHQIVSELG